MLWGLSKNVLITIGARRGIGEAATCMLARSSREIGMGMGEADDIAHPVVCLAFNESKFITGSEFVIDHSPTVTAALVS